MNGSSTPPAVYYARGWTPDWNADGLAADTLLVYDLGLRLANSRDWPQWESGSEFAAARHASNDQRAN